MTLFKKKTQSPVPIETIDQLYKTTPGFVTCDLYWDGGIRTESSLNEKAAFYALASKMAAVIKELIAQLGEEPLIGRDFCEHGRLYANWSDLHTYETYRELRMRLGTTNCQPLKLPENDDLIDMIVESNFRYFSYVAIYLPKTGAILCPSCHSEIIVYAQKDGQLLVTQLQQLAQKHSDGTVKLRITPPH